MAETIKEKRAKKMKDSFAADADLEFSDDEEKPKIPKKK